MAKILQLEEQSNIIHVDRRKQIQYVLVEPIDCEFAYVTLYTYLFNGALCVWYTVYANSSSLFANDCFLFILLCRSGFCLLSLKSKKINFVKEMNKFLRFFFQIYSWQMMTLLFLFLSSRRLWLTSDVHSVSAQLKRFCGRFKLHFCEIFLLSGVSSSFSRCKMCDFKHFSQCRFCIGFAFCFNICHFTLANFYQ